MYKENAEQQLNRFIAQDAASLKTKNLSLDFTVPRGAPLKKSQACEKAP